MFLKYFYDEKLAHASYLVGCQAFGTALVIDPGRNIAPYLKAAADNDLKITATAETHIHADFLSGARELSARTGATLYLSAEGGEYWQYQNLERFPHQLLKDGDIFSLGNLRFQVLHTPGHTPEHISFLLTDTAAADQPIGIFTGDFVFVGSIGRPDLLEKAAKMMGTAEVGAHQMFHSVNRFKQLPDYLQVWPAHGAGSACGKGLGAVPSSTVGYEKLFNGMLHYTDEAAFVTALLAGQPEAPGYFAMMKKLNKIGAPILAELPPVADIPAEQVWAILAAGVQKAWVVDTRPAPAFSARHLQGTLNIPADGSFTNWAGWLLGYDKPFYLIADPSTVSQLLIDLHSIGLDNCAGVIDPSIVQDNSIATQSYQSLPIAATLSTLPAQNRILLDVRAEDEWQAGHVAGAIHTFLGTLPEQITTLQVPKDQPIAVMCKSGGRSAIATALLQALGYTDVVNLAGGWQALPH
jgi:hydroxyacylglutathione hydrolase